MSMLVKNFWNDEVRLADGLNNVISQEREGSLERAAATADSVATVVSRLLEQLVVKGVLTLEEVNEMCGTSFTQ